MSKLCEANHGFFRRFIGRPATWQTVRGCALLVDYTPLPTQRIGLPKKTTTIMHKDNTGSTPAQGMVSASDLIDAKIRELNDWRGQTLARVRALVRQADPDVIEEVKWRGVPVWSHDGILCTGETYKQVVKMTFAKGAALEDPAGLFNSSLEGNTRRAIDVHEGEAIDEAAFKALIQAAVALNTAKRK